MVVGLASGFQRWWNAEPAQKRRAMQDALLEVQLRKLGCDLDSKASGFKRDRVQGDEEPAVSPGEAVTQAVRGWKIR